MPLTTSHAASVSSNTGVGGHMRQFFPAGAVFMMRPIASTMCARPILLGQHLGPSAVSWVLRPLVGLAHAPPTSASAFHEATQRGIQGSGFDVEQVVGLRSDGLANPVPVPGPTWKIRRMSMSTVR
jgi:hypothetical protein